MAPTQTSASVADTILNQLGGKNRLSIMLGASRFMSRQDGVAFVLGRNPEGIGTVLVVLCPNDLYAVWFFSARTHKVKNSATFVSADMLAEVIERRTGLYLSLGAAFA